MMAEAEIVDMASQFGVATIMVLLTVAIHGMGLFAMGRALRIEREFETRFQVDLASPRGLAFTLALVLAIFVLHGIEIWLYAFLYLAVGALPDLGHAVYFSTITYGTIGYDDEGMSHAWRLVAAIEGINGIILLGWSTAFFVTVVSRVSRHGG